MARVLIAGCGDVGTRLGLRLAADGHAVWGLRRDPASLPAPIRPLAADLAAGTGLDTLPDGLDHVVCTIAAGGGGEAAYRQAYVEAPLRLFEALERRGARVERVLFTSSTSVYGQDDGSEVDETAPAEPASPTAALLRRGEQEVLDGPYPAVVLRLAGLYGPGRTWLIDQLRTGRARCTPGVWSNRIHVLDAARACAHLLFLREPQPLYNGADDHPAPLCEVLDWLAGRLGVPAPARGTAADAMLRGNKRVSNRQLRRSGFQLRHPGYRDGYVDMLE